MILLCSGFRRFRLDFLRPFSSHSNCEIYARSRFRSENLRVKSATSRIGALFNTDARSKRSSPSIRPLGPTQVRRNFPAPFQSLNPATHRNHNYPQLTAFRGLGASRVRRGGIRKRRRPKTGNRPEGDGRIDAAVSVRLLSRRAGTDQIILKPVPNVPVVQPLRFVQVVQIADATARFNR